MRGAEGREKASETLRRSLRAVGTLRSMRSPIRTGRRGGLLRTLIRGSGFRSRWAGSHEGPEGLLPLCWAEFAWEQIHDCVNINSEC